MINIRSIDEANEAWPSDACYLAGLVPAFRHIKRWTLPQNYAGAEWPAYYSAGVGQSRDSDALERSNFAVMLDELGSENNAWGFDVRVVRESHFLVGWVEWIAIHQSSYGALAIADRLKGKLEDYPILNEEHYSELENDQADDVWRDCYSPFERIEYIRRNRHEFEFESFAQLLGCVRGDYFGGYASELLR